MENYQNLNIANWFRIADSLTEETMGTLEISENRERRKVETKLVQGRKESRLFSNFWSLKKIWAAFYWTPRSSFDPNSDKKKGHSSLHPHELIPTPTLNSLIYIFFVRYKTKIPLPPNPLLLLSSPFPPRQTPHPLFLLNY